jgi:hypothetical protein
MLSSAFHRLEPDTCKSGESLLQRLLAQRHIYKSATQLVPHLGEWKLLARDAQRLVEPGAA